MVAPSDNWIKPPSTNSSGHTGEGVIIDIGTGDGRFVYQSARQNPNKFYIGIDPNTRPLEKISEKIYRKPAKGGAGNVLFIQAAIEDLPAELNGVADEVHVHFPWSSLLRAVAIGEIEVLRNVRRICSTGALLEVVTGLDPERDQSEIERLGLTTLSLDFIDTDPMRGETSPWSDEQVPAVPLTRPTPSSPLTTSAPGAIDSTPEAWR